MNRWMSGSWHASVTRSASASENGRSTTTSSASGGCGGESTGYILEVPTSPAARSATLEGMRRTLLALLCAGLLVPIPAHAYRASGDGIWREPVVTYSDHTAGAYGNAAAMAVAAWNTTGMRVVLVPAPTAQAQIQIRGFRHGTHGLACVGIAGATGAPGDGSGGLASAEVRVATGCRSPPAVPADHGPRDRARARPRARGPAMLDDGVEQRRRRAALRRPVAAALPRRAARRHPRRRAPLRRQVGVGGPHHPRRVHRPRTGPPRGLDRGARPARQRHDGHPVGAGIGRPRDRRRAAPGCLPELARRPARHVLLRRRRRPAGAGHRPAGRGLVVLPAVARLGGRSLVAPADGDRAARRSHRCVPDRHDGGGRRRALHAPEGARRLARQRRDGERARARRPRADAGRSTSTLSAPGRTTRPSTGSRFPPARHAATASSSTTARIRRSNPASSRA